MKILLAIDDSQCSEAAARMVVQQMRADGAEVRLLHVLEPVWLAVDYELGEVRQIEAAREEGLKRGKELVEHIRSLVAKAGFTVSTAVEEGDPRLAIVDYAALGHFQSLCLHARFAKDGHHRTPVCEGRLEQVQACAP